MNDWCFCFVQMKNIIQFINEFGSVMKTSFKICFCCHFGSTPMNLPFTIYFFVVFLPNKYCTVIFTPNIISHVLDFNMKCSVYLNFTNHMIISLTSVFSQCPFEYWTCWWSRVYKFCYLHSIVFDYVFIFCAQNIISNTFHLLTSI